MTMREIKSLTDWPRTLNSRSVYAKTVVGITLRVIGVGRTTLRLMHGDGRVVRVCPGTIAEIIGT